MLKTTAKTALALAFVSSIAAPACAEPVENGTEVAQLLEALGDRCWAVDLDGTVYDAAAMSDVKGPIDIELECVLSELKVGERQADSKEYI